MEVDHVDGSQNNSRHSGSQRFFQRMKSFRLKTRGDSRERGFNNDRIADMEVDHVDGRSAPEKKKEQGRSHKHSQNNSRHSGSQSFFQRMKSFRLKTRGDLRERGFKNDRIADAEVDHVDGRSALEEKNQEVKSLQNRIKELEAKYKQTRFALKEKDEELRSFKDRVAGDVALSIKTGKTESLNNPVSKNRLKEMYEEFRQQWPKIKNHLRKKEDLKFVQALIQKKFEDATRDMDKKKEYVDKVFRLKEPSSESTSQKVREYRQSAILNLQLTLYHNRKDGACSKTFLSSDEGVKPQDVLEYLSCDCYWLGCLLALNNPPLQPDWENHEPGMDAWNMLPRNIRAASVMQRKQNQQ